MFQEPQHPAVAVEDHADGKRLVVAVPCKQLATLFAVPLEALKDTPTYTSIQVGHGKHLECGETLRYMDHSFQPTVAIRVSDTHLTVQALKDLEPGDPVTFNYNTTEWDMAEPFLDRETGRMVQGWAHLSDDDRMEWSHMAAKWLKA